MPRHNVPAALAALFIIGITCAKYGEYRAADRQRRLQKMVARGDSITRRDSAQHDSALAAGRITNASACPGATDISSWATVPLEGSPVTVPEVPSFEVADRYHSRSGEIVFSSSDGEAYRVTYGDREARFEDWQQYELVAECADVADVMPGTIKTGRDTRDGLVKQVFASYRLPDGHYVSLRGATNDVARQAQFVAAAHNLRLNR